MKCSHIVILLPLATYAYAPFGASGVSRLLIRQRGRSCELRNPPKLTMVTPNVVENVNRCVWVQSDAEMVQFENAFAGEWVGFESQFRLDGSVELIPEYLMPPDLVEWGVKVKGFEHLTSSAIAGDTVLMKRTRLLPATGCAVDALPTLTSSIQHHTASVAAFSDGTATMSDGLLLPERWTLILPLTAAESLGHDMPCRVQVEGHGLACNSITLRFEERATAFQNGKMYWEMFRDPAQLKKMKVYPEASYTSHARTGRWQVQETVVQVQEAGALRHASHTSEVSLLEGERRQGEAIFNNLICLPRGISVRLHSLDTESGAVELAWAAEEDGVCVVRKTIRREYEAGRVCRVATTFEKRV